MANIANVNFPPNFGNPLTAVERAQRSVFVGNIPYEATEEQLKEIFTQAGPVVSFRLVYDRETGKPKGYGFCEYQDVETAQSAMRNLNNHDFNGRPLRVGVAAGEQKDDNKSMQQAVGGPILESPYGEAVEPSKAPEAISKAVASLPPEQMFELMKQMKMCIQNNPNEARNMLLQNPQLAYALLQAQIVMKIVDPQVALAMLHRETEQIPPLLPASSATSEPSHNAPPAMQTAASHAGTGMTPASMPLSQPMSVAGGHMGNPMQGISMQGGSQLPGLDYRRDVDMPMAARSSLLGDHPQHSGQPGSMGQQHMDMHMGGNRGPPFMEGRGPRGPTPQQDMGSMHDMGPSRGPVSRTDMGPMHGMGGPRGPGPRSDMGQMHEMGMPRGPVPRPDMGPMRDMGGPRGPHPRAVRPDQPDPRGVSVGGDRGRAPPPRQAAPQVGAAAALPPGGIPGLSGSTSISPQDHEKAALIMQVLQLSDDQIAMLPPDQRQSILILKEQIARSGQAPS